MAVDFALRVFSFKHGAIIILHACAYTVADMILWHLRKALNGPLMLAEPTFRWFRMWLLLLRSAAATDQRQENGYGNSQYSHVLRLRTSGTGPETPPLGVSGMVNGSGAGTLTAAVAE